MTLAHPWFLLGAVLIPWVRGRLGKLVLLLVILGAAGPQLPLRLERTALLVDQSPSAGGAASRIAARLSRPGAFYLGFAERVAALPAAAARRNDLGRTSKPQRAIDEAVRRGAERIVLVSDGLWLQNPVSPVPVYTVYSPPAPHAGIERLLPPAEPRPGEVVEVGVLLSSTERTEAQLSFSGVGKDENRSLRLEPGRTAVFYRFRLERPVTLTVSLRSRLGSSKASLHLQPAGPGLALVVGDEAAARYLEAAGWQVHRGMPADLRQTPDLLVIGGPLSDWGLEERARLGLYLENGGSVLWTATPRGLFFGGWQNSELAGKIPLRPEPGRGAALVLVLDVSGSMADENPSKLARAVAGAKELLNAAGPGDVLGIVVFADEARWLLYPEPLTPQARRTAAARLGALQARGGTLLGPAYASAADALEKATAESRWLVVVSDGRLENADARAVIERARKIAPGVKTLTLALGGDADRAFLKKLAAAGAGEFFDLASPAALQNTLALLGKRAFKQSEVSGRFPLHIAEHPVTSSMERLPNLPVLLPARAQNWAQTLISTDSRRAVLAVGAAGGGRVAALATDLSRAWKNSPAAAQLLANLARWLSNTPARPRYDWRDSRSGRTLLVYGRFDPLPLASWRGRQAALEPTSPLSFRLRLPAGFDLPVRISSGGKTVFVAEPPPPSEWPEVDGRENLRRLARASGGAVLSGPPPPPRRLPLDVSRYLWGLALALFLLERWREYAVG